MGCCDDLSVWGMLVKDLSATPSQLRILNCDICLAGLLLGSAQAMTKYESDIPIVLGQISILLSLCCLVL